MLDSTGGNNLFSIRTDLHTTSPWKYSSANVRLLCAGKQYGRLCLLPLLLLLLLLLLLHSLCRRFLWLLLLLFSVTTACFAIFRQDCAGIAGGNISINHGFHFHDTS